MRTLVIGDIHGRIESLKGVLNIAGYDPTQDRLICLGDYVDNGRQSYEVMDFLIELDANSLHNNVYHMGNHDEAWIEILKNQFDQLRDAKLFEENNEEWWDDGGKYTYESYTKHSDAKIQRHLTQFYNKLKYYHKEDDKLFVHASIEFYEPIEETAKHSQWTLLWDRHLYMTAISQHSDTEKPIFGGYDKIYIGHTPTTYYDPLAPRYTCNVINLDQGCKIDGTLTAWVDGVDEYYQYVVGDIKM